MEIKELGHVVLYVTNLETVADFYRDTLGFREIVRRGRVAVFSSGRTHHELLLIEIGGKKIPRMIEPGLYHIGFKIGDSDEELRTAREELTKAGATILGMTDHGVTHSLYIKDPDGNELELYVDVSDAWKKDPRVILSDSEHLNLE